ncbi:MAG: DUF1272 domain-containing protein [Candidatus Eremiobacteraeota bacterium]|nr:DUF1272 domain-containing protein [Candidatus Eremiobacteraeota bacterium]MCW5870360.1 DUF1272 domain-containing protein [Candidatus Eremiobacteraeota bacterium]
MLEMRSSCEKCGAALPADSLEAVICSYECTFCRSHELAACPNCQGELVRRPTRVAAARVGVVVTADGYELNRVDGSRGELTDLRQVEILNEDEVYFILIGPENSLVIPQGTPGADELLVHLQKLPGFSHQRFLEAMEGQGRFVCWERPPLQA